MPFSRGPERSRPFDDIVDEARAPRRRRLPRGHAARPERQLLRPRPRAGAALRPRRRGALGRPPPRSPRPPRPRRADPRHRRPAHGRRPAGDRAPALRDVAPVGPVRPAHRRAGRLRQRLRAPAPAGPVRRRRGPAPDGPPVHDRALPRAPRPDPRGRPGHHRLDRHHRRVLRRDRGAVRGDAGAARDRPLRPGLRGRLLAAARHAGDAARRRRAGRRQAAPAQRAARAPGGDRPRAQPGVARPGGRASSSTASPRRGPRPRRRAGDRRSTRSRRSTGPDPRQQARPSRRARRARRPRGHRPDRPRRPVRAAGRARRRRDATAPAAHRHRRARRRPARPPRDRARRGAATAGPTAEIISADSRQVFRGLDIGTAKATAADRARVPHHGLDLVDPDEPFSVADFVAHAGAVLADLRRAAASRSWPAAPASTSAPSPAASTPPRCRAIATSAPDSRPSWTSDGLEPSSRASRLIAPALAATVDLRNPRRVVRALEIAELRGDAPRPPARGYAGPRRLARARHATRPSTAADRHARARAQFDGGLLDEARALRRAIRSGPARLLGDRLSRGLGRARRRARRATTPSSSTRRERSRSPNASARGSAPSRTSTGCRPARTRHGERFRPPGPPARRLTRRDRPADADRSLSIVAWPAGGRRVETPRRTAVLPVAALPGAARSGASARTRRRMRRRPPAAARSRPAARGSTATSRGR